MTAPIQPIHRALLSVSDKTGLINLARALTDRGVSLIASGGTRRTLSEAGMQSLEVSAVTGFPEMMDGRVKTLHPHIHGGILGRRDQDKPVMAEHGIDAIDLVVVNLYPFAKTTASGADVETCIENIDIGGPALIRAAAKNHRWVTVLTDPSDYTELLRRLGADGGTDHDFRRLCAQRAYAHTGAYDAVIAQWFAAETGEQLPPDMAVGGRKGGALRYGENPHQAGAVYLTGEPRPGVAAATQLQGKALSYNNLNDTDAAYELVAELDQPAIAIIKHANPCGAAVGASLREAYERARACDPDSAFGGIIAANRTLDGEAAEAILSLFAEVVIAPGIAPEAAQLFAAKKNLRVLDAGALPNPGAPGLSVRGIAGGLLVQQRDTGRLRRDELTVATARAPTEAEWADLLFAWTVAKHVKSNAIVYAKDGATVGIGAGQMSRVDSARIAARKAEDGASKLGLAGPLTRGSAVASDAFFPFADGLEATIAAGATAVIQPGGAMRDAEVIAAADAAGIAMVLTGMRHFRH